MPLAHSSKTLASVRYEETSTTPLFKLGERDVSSEGAHWVYVQANGPIAQYAACKVDNDYQLTELTTTISGAEPTDVGIAQVAFADNEYGWVFEGPGGGVGSGIKVKVLGLCATDVPLYTTATAGALDDTATDLIEGLTITATDSGSGSSIECFAAKKLVTNG